MSNDTIGIYEIEIDEELIETHIEKDKRRARRLRKSRRSRNHRKEIRNIQKLKKTKNDEDSYYNSKKMRPSDARRIKKEYLTDYVMNNISDTEVDEWVEGN